MKTSGSHKLQATLTTEPPFYKRGIFDLDADSKIIDAALAEHSELEEAVLNTPGVRIPGDAKPLDEWAERLTPWRSYLTTHLWRVP